MDKRSEQQIRESITVVTKMHRDGVLTADVYHKLMVCLAYEFAVLGEDLRAAALIQALPPSYFAEHLPRQMAEDEKYRECAVVLADRLVKAGIVVLGPKVVPTMPAASA